MPAPSSHRATHRSPADQLTPGRSTEVGPPDHVLVLTDAGVAEVLAVDPTHCRPVQADARC